MVGECLRPGLVVPGVLGAVCFIVFGLRLPWTPQSSIWASALVATLVLNFVATRARMLAAALAMLSCVGWLSCLDVGIPVQALSLVCLVLLLWLLQLAGTARRIKQRAS
jgi:hypothetical protein